MVLGRPRNFRTVRDLHGTIEDALRSWGKFDSQPHRVRATISVVNSVIAADGSLSPTFYVTSGRSYVGVLADDGHRLLRIQGRQIWSRCRIDGMLPRVTPPDDDLPYRWEL